MQYSIIKLSEIKQNSDFRLDAEYYHPFFIKINNKIKNFKDIIKFKDIILSIKNGDDFREYKKEGINYLRTGDFKNNYLDLLNCVKVDKNLKSKINLKIGDLLITRKGNYGKIEVVNNDNINSFISSEIFHISINKIFNPYFIKIYLMSKYGKFFIERYIHGVVNFSITQESLKELIIPILSNNFQTQIANIVNQSHELRQQANNLYQEAENILLEELNIKNYKPNNKKFFIKKLSETQKAERIDAEYFQPKYDDIINIIKNYSGGYNKLENFICKYSTGYAYKSENYLKSGIPLIRISNIGKNILNLNDNPVFISEEYSNISKKDIAKSGNILISMSGTIGNVVEIPDNIEKCCINQRVLSFECKKINSKYLTLFLNSNFGAMQFERIGVGGVQINLSYNDIKNLLVPLLSEDKQQQISNKIQESFEKRNYSDKLIDIAKRAVEIAIEEDEDSAIKYIENN